MATARTSATGSMSGTRTGAGAVLERGRVGDTYNFGGRSERTDLAVVEAICDLLDEISPAASGPGSRRSLIDFVADRPGHDSRYAMDSSKIERELGWRAQENFESGLAKTVRRFCDNRKWWLTFSIADISARGSVSVEISVILRMRAG